MPSINKHFSVTIGMTVRQKWRRESASDLWQPQSKAAQGLSKGAEFYSVAVDQIDEEKQRAERNGTSQHGFHQQHRPTAQQEDVDKQPEHTTERYNINETKTQFTGTI